MNHLSSAMREEKFLIYEEIQILANNGSTMAEMQRDTKIPSVWEYNTGFIEEVKSSRADGEQAHNKCFHKYSFMHRNTESLVLLSFPLSWIFSIKELIKQTL